MVQSSRPPVPRPAERAKTIAVRSGPAVLMPTVAQPDNDAGDQRVTPILHHVHSSGTVSVVLPDEHPLVVAAHQLTDAELAVLMELADPAPVPLREPVRGLLWVTGWLSPLSARASRERAVRIAETRPDPRLLDVGHGTSVLRLSIASLVLSDADGTHSLRPQMFHTAEADPFHGYEGKWLRHLETDHADVITQLRRHVPAELRDGTVRPLGLDRYGLRLRVEQETEDHDVRLAFSRAVRQPRQLAAELHRLLGCPFLAKAGASNG